MRRGARRGSALMEYALVFAGVIAPLTFGLIAMAEMMWIWHSVVDWTRLGARYAATHCWQSNGQNVVQWMRANVPAMPDQQAFTSGSAEVTVDFFRKNPDSGVLEAFQCDGECSTACVPDVVTVHVRNYEFRTFVSYLGIPPVQIPDFQTTMPVEGMGCDPETGVCAP